MKILNKEVVENELIVTENIAFISNSLEEKQVLRKCYKVLKNLFKKDVKQEYVIIKLICNGHNKYGNKGKMLYGVYKFKTREIQKINFKKFNWEDINKFIIKSEEENADMEFEKEKLMLKYPEMQEINIANAKHNAVGKLDFNPYVSTSSKETDEIIKKVNNNNLLTEDEKDILICDLTCKSAKLLVTEENLKTIKVIQERMKKTTDKKEIKSLKEILKTIQG